MPGYEMLHYYLEGLAARDSVLSSIEIATDKADKDSDGQRHISAIDWILNVDSERLRKEIVKVTVEKQGKKWRFTSLEPVDFFKPPASSKNPGQYTQYTVSKPKAGDSILNTSFETSEMVY